jgi:ribonuclease P protein component
VIDKAHRFHGYGSLRFVYQKGDSVRGTYSVLRYKVNTRRKNYRLAVVVSRKVNKSAVVRNRIRRRIYEYSRDCLKNVKTPYDLVVVIYSDAVAEVEAEDLRQKVCLLFERAGIIKDGILDSKEIRK